MHYCVPAVPAGIRSCLAPNFAAAFVPLRPLPSLPFCPALPCPAMPCHALPCAAALPGLQGAVPATEFGNVKERGEAPATSGHAKEGWTRWK